MCKQPEGRQFESDRGSQMVVSSSYKMKVLLLELKYVAYGEIAEASTDPHSNERYTELKMFSEMPVVGLPRQ